jgi:hypothetical protein
VRTTVVRDGTTGGSDGALAASAAFRRVLASGADCAPGTSLVEERYGMWKGVRDVRLI